MQEGHRTVLEDAERKVALVASLTHSNPLLILCLSLLRSLLEDEDEAQTETETSRTPLPAG
jgi:hypothetical protein